MRTIGRVVALLMIACCLLTGCDNPKAPTSAFKADDFKADAGPAKQTAAQPAAPAAAPAAAAAAQPATKPVAAQSAPAPAAPAAPAAAAASGAIPAPPAVANAQLFGMLRLREPNALLDHLASWAALAQPEMTGDMMRMQLAMLLGIDLKDFRAGENAAVFALAPAANANEPKGAALLPIGHTSKTALALKERFSANEITSVSAGQYMMLSIQDPAGVAEGAKQADALIALDKGAIASDVQLWLNIDAVMQKFGPMLTMLMQGLQANMAQALSQAPGAPANSAMAQAAVQTELTAFMDLLHQLQSLTIGLDFGAERIDLAATVQGKAGSGLEKALQTGTIDVPALAEFTSQDALVRFQQTLTDPKGFMELYVKYLTMALGQGQNQNQAALDQIKDFLKDFDQFKKMSMGGSMGFSPEGKLVYEVVAQTDNNAAYLKLVQDKVTKLLNAGALHDLYKGMGLDLTVQQDPATRKVGGADVTRYTIKVQVAATIPAEQKEVLMKMLNDLPIEAASIGEYVVVAVGEPIDALAGRVAAKQQVAPLAAKAAYGPGGVFYMDLNVGALVAFAKQNMPAEQAAAMPNFPKTLAPIMAAGTHASGMAYYRLGVPKALVTEIIKVAKEKQAQQMGGATPGQPKAGKGKKKAAQPKSE